MSDRVSVDSREFQAFLADNSELVERYKKLLDTLSSLRKMNKDLEEKLHSAEQRLNLLEKKTVVETEQADEILRKARAAIARMMEETERRLSE